MTQGEYLALMGYNPSNYQPPNFTEDLTRPVEFVDGFEATAYCTTLTEQERAAGRIPTNCVYRLPTEADWEYGCRGGTSTRFSYGDDPGYANLSNYAWYWNNGNNQTHPVGGKLANPWGLHDMHGNVWEWCQDWFGAYAGGIALDPQGPATGSYRVGRGGGWDASGFVCRSAYRHEFNPAGGVSVNGFRLVLALEQP